VSYQSNIQWTDSTWNPWYGCIKVAEGCKNCYMYRDFDRWKKDPRDVQRSKTRFHDPLKWADPRLIFTCSLSDFMIRDAIEWRDDAIQIIEQTPHHLYQILTKRWSEAQVIIRDYQNRWNRPFPRNCIIIFSASTQKEFDRCWPLLDSLKGEFGLKVGLSLEPMLECINILEMLSLSFRKVDWVIVGGESGHKVGKYQHRFCGLDWLMSIVTQCHMHFVPVFLKQLGSHLATEMKLKHPHGGDASEWLFTSGFEPVRQFPNFMPRA
jgi:protein gp37